MSWPHILSFSRVVAGPVVAALILMWPGNGDLVAALVFGGASLTDLVDGKLARKSLRVSALGVFLDTTADKILVSITLVAMAIAELAPAWMVLVIIGREFLVSGLRSYAASCGRIISAHIWGKGKAALTMVAASCVLVAAAGRDGRWIGGMMSHQHWDQLLTGAIWLLGVATVLTIVSGARYVVDALPLLRGTPDVGSDPMPRASGDRVR